MLKIRLMRIGGKKKPFYRIVVQEERSKRTGGYVELLGSYNPLTEPKDIKINQERVDYWIKQGAQLSVGYLRIIGKAPQRPPRKPKKAASPPAGEPKEKKEEVKQESPKEEVKTEESAPTSEETAKSSESEAVTEESQNTEPSGASTTAEPAPETSKEEKKDEGSS